MRIRREERRWLPRSLNDVLLLLGRTLVTIALVVVLADKKGLCSSSSSKQPAFLSPLQNQTSSVDRNVTFTCFVSDIGEYKVGWVKADTKAIQAIGDHVITHNPRVSVSRGERHSQKHHLHITRVQLEDAGPYMCQLNTDPMKSQHGYLQVIQPVDIIQVTGTEGILEGSSANLTCKANGYPPPKVSWMRRNRGDKITVWDRSRKVRKEVREVQGNTLYLHHVTRTQMGQYICIAKNGFPPAVSRTVDLRVNFRPVIRVRQSTIYQREGRDAILECIIEAFPRGYSFWENNLGTIIKSSEDTAGKYVTSEYIRNEYTVNSRLTVKNFTAQDVGGYKCVCTNDMSMGRNRVMGEIYLYLYSDLTTTTTTTTTEEEISYYDEYNSINNNNNYYTNGPLYYNVDFTERRTGENEAGSGGGYTWQPNQGQQQTQKTERPPYFGPDIERDRSHEESNNHKNSNKRRRKNRKNKHSHHLEASAASRVAWSMITFWFSLVVLL